MKNQDPYNKAVRYLTDKYGEIFAKNYSNELDDFNKMPINDQRLGLLVSQYSLGISAKRELEVLVVEMGL